MYTEFIFLLRTRKFLNLVNTMLCRSLDLVDHRLSLNIKQDCTHIPSVFCAILVNALTICKSNYRGSSPYANSLVQISLLQFFKTFHKYLAYAFWGYLFHYHNFYAINKIYLEKIAVMK